MVAQVRVKAGRCRFFQTLLVPVCHLVLVEGAAIYFTPLSLEYDTRGGALSTLALLTARTVVRGAEAVVLQEWRTSVRIVMYPALYVG